MDQIYHCDNHFFNDSIITKVAFSSLVADSTLFILIWHGAVGAGSISCCGHTVWHWSTSKSSKWSLQCICILVYYSRHTPYIVIYEWVDYSLSFIKQANNNIIVLVCNLISAVFVTVVLSIKNCFMTKWFVRETSISSVSSAGRYRRTDNSNPYFLIYRVLKFAKGHKSPIRRSALTYWEDEIPSRIDLGKRKYGGPFTNEEVESVKTFLQLLKLLLSLSGILITSYLIRLISPFRTYSDNEPLISNICQTATISILILCHICSCFHKCRLSISGVLRTGSSIKRTNLWLRLRPVSQDRKAIWIWK